MQPAFPTLTPQWRASRRRLRALIALLLILCQGWAPFASAPVLADVSTESNGLPGELVAAPLPAGKSYGAEAAPAPNGAYGPALPAGGLPAAGNQSHAQGVLSGIRIYQQNVNCADPQYPEVTLPYEELTNAWKSIGGTYYLCVDGYGFINLNLHAEVLGYGSVATASLKCVSGCTEFEDITQPEEIIWERGSCKHRLRRAETTVAIEPGKYKLVISAGYFGTFYCKGEDTFSYTYADVSGAVIPRTFGSGGGNGGGDGCDYNNFTGGGLDPVNTLSGNFTYQITDFHVPSRGLPLTFERSYNSYDTYPGPLGRGWTHRYNMQLWVEPERVTWLSARGARLGFTANADGSFTPETGIRATLAFTQNTYTLTQGDNLVYTFNPTGTLTGMSDSLGHTTSLVYTNGNLTAIQGEDGRALTLTYDLQKRIKTISDPLLRTAIYTYTDSALTAYRAPDGQVWTYVYSNSLMTALTAPNGGVLTHGYDAQRRVVTQTNPLGVSGVISYADGLTAIRDANGNFTYHTYNESGALNAVTDATGRTVTYTRDHDQNITGADSDDARSVSLEWNDCACSPTVVTDTLGQVTQYNYDGENQLTEAQDALGRVTRYAYDGHRPITITDALSGVIVNTYNDDNLLVRTVDHGLTTTYGYDAFGQLVAVTNTLGQATRYGYDAAGRLITTTNPAGQVTVNQYDAGDHLLRVTENYTSAGGQNHLGLYNQVTTYAYGLADAWGHSPRAWMTDTHGQITRYEYDLAGDLIRVTANYSASVGENYQGMWNRVTQYAYDGGDVNAERRQTWITDTLGLVTHNEYDGLGRLIRVTTHYSPSAAQNAQGIWNRVTQYAYTPADLTSSGQRTHITDTLGNVTYTEYDAMHRAVRAWQNYLPGYPQNYQNTYNRLTEYGYDAVGNQILMTDTLGNVTYTEYDALNRAARTWQNYLPGYPQNYYIPPAGGSEGGHYNRLTEYGYDAAGRQTLVTDTLGNVTYTEYDGAGRAARTWQNYLPGYPQNYLDTYNRVSTYGYDELGRTVLVTDTLGHATYTEYDDLGRAVAVTTNFVDGVYDPAHPDEDRRTLTIYNSLGQVAARVQLSGTQRITTTYAYDALDRVITTTNALGYTSVTHYDDAGRRSESIDALGNRTTYTYDAVGQLLYTTDALGGVTTYSYDALGRQVEIANSESRITRNEYDDAGRLVGVTMNYSATGPADSRTNLRTTYAYDALGRRTVTTDATGIATYSAYDDAGRLYSAQDALGHTTVYTYDALGRQAEIANSESRITKNEYDAAGRVVAVTENYVPGGPADGQTNRRTVYTYDAAGNYTHVSDPLNHTTVYTYDGAGRLIAQQDALGYVTAYAYDALGRRSAVVRPDAAGAQTTVTHYDLLGRAVRVDYPASGAVAAFSVDHAYDALGRRTVMTETAGLTTWSYDALGRVLRISDPFTGVVEYGYDTLGNRTALTVTAADSELRIANYEFDAVNRLVRVSDWATGTTAYGYDAAGRILTETLPNGVMTAYGYDGAGRQVSAQHQGITGTLATYTYTLDGLGRQIGVDERLRTGAGLTATVRAITHTFDGAGRLTHSAYSTGESFAYEHDATGNRTAITAVTPLSGTLVTTQSYDAANRLSARSRSDGHNYLYTWSQQGQLLAEYTQGIPARTFVYDGAGRMTKATVFTLTTEFAYNGLGARLALSVAGQTTRYTLDYAAGNRILVETTPTETVSYLYGRDCLGEQRNDTWLYYLHDLTGHVRQGADAGGAVAGAWLFDPDGTVLAGPDGPVSHLICSGVYDRSTGLIYQNGRYFDPSLGIWLALTPLMVIQAWKKRRRGGYPAWVLVLGFGLLAVGTLSGCCTPWWHLPPCTDGGSGGLGPGDGTPGIGNGAGTPGTGDNGTPPPSPSPSPSPSPPPPTPTPPHTPSGAPPDMPPPNLGPCPCSAPPDGWEWKLAPDNQKGLPFTITHYNTTVESLHSSQSGAGIELPGLDLLRQVSPGFVEQVRIQGSGYLDMGGEGDYNGYINYTVSTGSFRRTNCPETANGCAIALETGATSQNADDRRATKIEITGDNPTGNGSGTLICIESLNREILVNDTGGGVGQYQIDVYSGLESSSTDMSFPGNHQSMVWRLERKEL